MDFVLNVWKKKIIDMAMIKKAQKGLPVKKKAVVDSVESEMFPGKKIPKSQSNYATGNIAKMLEGAKSKPKAKPAPKKKMKDGGKLSKAKAGKEMIKRADGSYSQRGLWDNIRAAKGSGKKPTAAMLKQEKKIKAKSK
jgi:hypothetical protein